MSKPLAKCSTMARRRKTPWALADTRIRQVARALGVSHVQLCEQAGCSYYLPKQRARHHPNAPPDYLERIARRWGFQPDLFELPAEQFAFVLLPIVQHAIHGSLPPGDL